MVADEVNAGEGAIRRVITFIEVINLNALRISLGDNNRDNISFFLPNFDFSGNVVMNHGQNEVKVTLHHQSQNILVLFSGSNVKWLVNCAVIQSEDSWRDVLQGFIDSLQKQSMSKTSSEIA